MSKKKVLNEVRRFMKLANLNANVSSNFITKIEEGEIPVYARDDESTSLDEEIEDEIEVEDEMELEEPAPADFEDDMEMDIEMDVDVEEEAVISDEEAAILIALGQKLAAAQEIGAEEEVISDVDDEIATVDDEIATVDDEISTDDDEPADETLEEILDAVLGEDEVAEAQKYGGDEGDIPDADRKKKGHYGRGPKTKETAEEERESDFGTNRRRSIRDRPRAIPKLRNEDVVQEVLKRVRARLATMAKK